MGLIVREINRQSYSQAHTFAHHAKLKVYAIFYESERAEMREKFGGYSRHVFVEVGKLLFVPCRELVREYVSSHKK